MRVFYANQRPIRIIFATYTWDFLCSHLLEHVTASRLPPSGSPGRRARSAARLRREAERGGALRVLPRRGPEPRRPGDATGVLPVRHHDGLRPSESVNALDKIDPVKCLTASLDNSVGLSPEVVNRLTIVELPGVLPVRRHVGLRKTGPCTPRSQYVVAVLRFGAVF